MAKRYGSRSRSRVRSGNRTRSRSGYRNMRSQRRSSGRRGSAPQHTVRIVLEHPASNPQLTVPVGQQVDTSKPARARF